jgi:hypothetical protein
MPHALPSANHASTPTLLRQPFSTPRKGSAEPAKESTLAADEVAMNVGRLSIGRVLSVPCGGGKVTYGQQQQAGQ